MRTSGDAWLLGDHGAPLIPPSWGKGGMWNADVSVISSRGVRRRLSASSTELCRRGLGGTLSGEIDWTTTALNMVTAIMLCDPPWGAGRLASDFSNVDEGLLGELPLLQGTAQVLRALNFDANARISALAALERRELVSHPVALLDLSVTLECWWPNRDMSPAWIAISEAHTLEDAARALLKEYINSDGNRLDESWVGFLQRRYSWGVPRATLDALGKEAKLTRERVRQIELRINERKGLRLWPIPGVLAEVLEYVQDGGFHDIPQHVLGSGVATDDDWTGEELVELLEWFGRPDGAEELNRNLGAASEADSARRAELDEYVKTVRKARSKLGYVPLVGLHVSDGTEIFPDRVLECLNLMYPQVATFGNWALASSRDSSSLAFAAARQLGITSPLRASELYLGLQRFSRYRQSSDLPNQEVVLGLLEAAGEITFLDGELVIGETARIEHTAVDGWLISILESADGNVLHKEVINRAAIDRGLNLSTLTVYYGYHPCFRSGDGDGLVHLVGRESTPDDNNHAKLVAEATRTQTNLTWRATDVGLDIELVVGSNLLSTGVLGPPRALANLWPQTGAAISCYCGFSSSGRVARSGNMLTGLGLLLQHFLAEHQLKEGGLVRMRLDGEYLRALA
jgi:hypothetical protein